MSHKINVDQYSEVRYSRPQPMSKPKGGHVETQTRKLNEKATSLLRKRIRQDKQS